MRSNPEVHISQDRPEYPGGHLENDGHERHQGRNPVCHVESLFKSLFKSLLCQVSANCKSYTANPFGEDDEDNTASELNILTHSKYFYVVF